MERQDPLGDLEADAPTGRLVDDRDGIAKLLGAEPDDGYGLSAEEAAIHIEEPY
jgi:hypothetical protein